MTHERRQVLRETRPGLVDVFNAYDAGQDSREVAHVSCRSCGAEWTIARCSLGLTIAESTYVVSLPPPPRHVPRWSCTARSRGHTLRIAIDGRLIRAHVDSCEQVGS